MPIVFIAGSITIKKLDLKVQERIMNIIVQSFSIIVGDADGADTAIQNFLHLNNASNVTVYCSGARPRNNIGSWPVHCVTSYHKVGSRAYFTAKDLEMAEQADYGLMIWDSKSTGTLSNVFELLERRKNALVFIHKIKDFSKIRSASDIENLLTNMSPASRAKAEDKITLSERLTALHSKERQHQILADRKAHDLGLQPEISSKEG